MKTLSVRCVCSDMVFMFSGRVFLTCTNWIHDPVCMIFVFLATSLKQVFTCKSMIMSSCGMLCHAMSIVEPVTICFHNWASLCHAT